jgi:MFS family permease
MLYDLRLLLGVYEAGYVTTTYYYVGTPYSAYMSGFRTSLISIGFTFSGAFPALIAYGIFHIKSKHWAPWQLLLLLGGAITLTIGRCMSYWTANKAQQGVVPGLRSASSKRKRASRKETTRNVFHIWILTLFSVDQVRPWAADYFHRSYSCKVVFLARLRSRLDTSCVQPTMIHLFN